MSNTPNTKNVSASKPKKAGCVYKAPLGTTLPTDASSELDDAFKCLGFVSEDGIRNNNTASTTEVKAFGGEVVANPQSEKPDNWQFKLIEALNDDVLKTVYGDSNVTGTLAAGLHVKATSDQAGSYAWVIDLVLGKEAKRIVIAEGQVTEVGEVTYKDDEVIGYDLTVAAHYVNGTSHDEYIKTLA